MTRPLLFAVLAGLAIAGAWLIWADRTAEQRTADRCVAAVGRAIPDDQWRAGVSLPYETQPPIVTPRGPQFVVDVPVIVYRAGGGEYTIRYICEGAAGAPVTARVKVQLKPAPGASAGSVGP